MIRSTLSPLAAMFLVLLLLGAPSPASGQASKFQVWESYNVHFDPSSEEAPISLIGKIVVQSMCSPSCDHVWFTFRAPEGDFEIDRPPSGFNDSIEKRDGFKDQLAPDHKSYRMFLGSVGLSSKGVSLYYHLRWTGEKTLFWKSPPEVDFPGVKIDYEYSGEARVFDATTVSSPMRFMTSSRALGSFVRKYSGLRLGLVDRGASSPWTFFGREKEYSIGVVGVEGSVGSRGYFRLQSGQSDVEKDILVEWVRQERGRKNAIDEAFTLEQLRARILGLGEFEITEQGQPIDATFGVAKGKCINGRMDIPGANRSFLRQFTFCALNQTKASVGRDLFILVTVEGTSVENPLEETIAVFRP